MILGIAAKRVPLGTPTPTPTPTRADRTYTFDGDEGKALAAKLGMSVQSDPDAGIGTTLAARFLHSGNSTVTTVQFVADGDSLTIRYRCSSETFDRFRVYKDDVLLLTDSGSLAVKTLVIPLSGSHTIKMTYTKDGSSTAGADTVFIPQLILTNGLALVGPYTVTEYDFESGVPALFAPATAASWYSYAVADATTGTTKALRSAPIGNSGNTEFTISMPKGLVEMRYRVSAENFDKFFLYRDGYNMLTDQGDTGLFKTVFIGVGPVAKDVRFRYAKDGSTAVGLDSVMIGKVRIVAET